MATSIRGRSGSRSRTTSRGYNFSGRIERTTNRGGNTINVPPAWKQCNNVFNNKVSSYRTLINQTKGPAKCARPSPSTLNTFANWINKGAIIQTCSTAQLAKWAKATNKNINTRTLSPTTCKNILCKKFGKSAIKAVARTKSGSFMVATAPVVQGRTFCFPK